MEAARAGDRAALDQLLRRHYERIHAICRRIAGGSRDADDACQEALIKIVRGLARFDGRAAFGTWAYRIATNAALDELRRRDRRPALRAVGDDERSEEPTDPSAERRVTAVEDRLALDEALGGLAEEFRVAVVLRDVADLDYEEIADLLDVPLGTVKSRIARGRRALADRLRVEDLPPVRGDAGPPGAHRPGASTDVPGHVPTHVPDPASSEVSTHASTDTDRVGNPDPRSGRPTPDQNPTTDRRP